MNLLSRLFWPLFFGAIFYFAYISLFVLPDIKAEAGGQIPLDIAILGYSFEEAKAFFEATKASAGNSYSSFHEFDDVIFPALYGVAFALALWNLTYGWPKTVRTILTISPLGATALDYYENAKIKAMMALDTADITASNVAEISILTENKFILLGITFSIMVIIPLRNFVLNSLPEKKRSPVDEPEKTG